MALATLAFAACGTEPQIGSRGRPDAAAVETGMSDARVVGEVREAGPRPMPDQSWTPSQDCVNLQCRQRVCAGNAKTTVSGVVYDPAGVNPLYNVAVFVPNEQPKPFTFGATCDSCDSLYTGKAIAATLTDATGHFKLENVPEGADVPLVIQIGKWRRQLTLANVSSCVDNPQPGNTLRLPRNRSEGDIPKIAISTGGADTLECLLRRVGVDADEYSVGNDGEGRIHIFQGGGTSGNIAPNTSPAAPRSHMELWSSVDKLSAYDLVLLSCESAETKDMNQQVLHDYASAGGRVFASHYHYNWFVSGPYGDENLAKWSRGSNDMGRIDGEIVTKLPNGMPFAKGEALATWLGTVGALTDNKLPIEDAKHNADVDATHIASQAWIVADAKAKAPGATQYFSFNTPTDAQDNVADQAGGYCGRVVYSDLHVGAASQDDGSKPVPEGCSEHALSPQEAALEFMLFDLSSCITPDELPPEPPPVI